MNVGASSWSGEGAPTLLWRKPSLLGYFEAVSTSATNVATASANRSGSSK